MNHLLNHGFFNIFIKIIVLIFLAHVFIKVVILVQVIFLIFISCRGLRLLVLAIINPKRGLNSHDFCVFFINLLSAMLLLLFRVSLLDLLLVSY
jgi:hypothetical protein